MAAPPPFLLQCDKMCGGFFVCFFNFTVRDEFKTNTKSLYFYILVFTLLTCGVGLFRGREHWRSFADTPENLPSSHSLLLAAMQSDQ